MNSHIHPQAYLVHKEEIEGMKEILKKKYSTKEKKKSQGLHLTASEIDLLKQIYITKSYDAHTLLKSMFKL